MCGKRACAVVRPSGQICAAVAVCGGARGSNLAVRAWGAWARGAPGFTLTFFCPRAPLFLCQVRNNDGRTEETPRPAARRDTQGPHAPSSNDHQQPALGRHHARAACRRIHSGTHAAGGTLSHALHAEDALAPPIRALTHVYARTLIALARASYAPAAMQTRRRGCAKPKAHCAPQRRPRRPWGERPAAL